MCLLPYRAVEHEDWPETDYFQLMQDFTTRHIGATRARCDTPGCTREAELAGMCLRCLEAEDEARRERIDREIEERERRDFES